MKDINSIKQKIFKNNFNIIILVIILISTFIIINVLINELNLTPIDLTKDKLYTLSEDSKEQISKINQEVHIYFFGYSESSSIIMLAKQYHNINDKISAEAIDILKRPDLAKKYGIENSETSIGIIVEAPERYKVLTNNDFVTYDTNTFETFDITEQKLTNAILDTTISVKPHIYFLTGHEEKNISNEVETANALLQNEINDVTSLDLLKEEMPENCDCLVILNPQKDFDEIETNKILEYANKGGNILWMNNPTIIDVDFPNINKILDTYGFRFSKGMVGEQDRNRILLGNPFLIIPNISYTEITKDIYTGEGVAFAGTGKINFVDDQKLNELNVQVNNFIMSSENSIYIEDYTAENLTKANNSEKGSFILGTEINKKFNGITNSKMIVFSNCNYITDLTASEQSTTRLINIYNNKDLFLNSIAYLTNRGGTIRIRKDSGVVTYTATNNQDIIVRIIIFLIPLLIIFSGIIIRSIRRKNK